MKLVLILLSLAGLAACGATPARHEDQAVADFIAVSAPGQHDSIRTRGQWDYEVLGERYVILDSGNGKYLVEFRRRCHELDERPVKPDLRYQRNVLRARFDTIRGCVIERLYAIDDVAAEELKQLVSAADGED